MDQIHEERRGPGELVVVATPLGNLGDLSPRALDVLTTANVVYCEDTRHSRTLFSAFGVRPAGRLEALHQHNEAAMCDVVVARVAAGDVVALVSDAGTPGISDPGARIVAAVAAAGLRVTTAPGPSAVVAALSVSGLDTERFVMDGFVPRKAGERRELFDRWAREDRTIVAFESPQRIGATLAELAGRFADRPVAVVRELTKMHEEVVRGSLDDVSRRFAGREVKGEVVVVLAGATTPPPPDDALRAALGDELAAGASVRDAATAVADALGVSHRHAYAIALTLRGDQGATQ